MYYACTRTMIRAPGACTYNSRTTNSTTRMKDKDVQHRDELLSSGVLLGRLVFLSFLCFFFLFFLFLSLSTNVPRRYSVLLTIVDHPGHGN